MTTSSTSDIRAWAQSQGQTVGDRGRLPAELVAAYHAAQQTGATDITVETVPAKTVPATAALTKSKATVVRPTAGKAKATAVKPTAVKATAVKATAVKATAVKAAAVKPTAKVAAVKAAVVKPTVKTAAKPVAVKAAPVAPITIKSAAPVKPVAIKPQFLPSVPASELPLSPAAQAADAMARQFGAIEANIADLMQRVAALEAKPQRRFSLGRG